VGFRGSQQARIDEKGRLKVPADFRAVLEQAYGPRVFVTSLDGGESAVIYPMPVWEALEAKVLQLPSLDPRRLNFLRKVNRLGQTLELDAQGRILLPQSIREVGVLVGDVDVVGHVTMMEVWDRERLRAKLHGEPITEAELSDIGS
jgi:MraZ protein